MIAAGPRPAGAGPVVTGALKSPWVVRPVFAGFSILSPSWLWLVMPALFALVAVARLGGLRAPAAAGAPGPAVAVGHRRGVRPDSYTAFGFANPTRRVLAAALHTRAEVRDMDGAQHQSASEADVLAGEGAEAVLEPGRPDGVATPGVHIWYRSDVIEVVEQYLYRPLQRPFLRLVRLAKRLQSGRLDAYLAYMLIALIALLAVVTAVH